MAVDNDLLEVSFDECLVGADVHVPGHSEKWLKALIEYARVYEIKNLLLAGDFWNLDALSRFELKDSDLNLKKELFAGKTVLEKLTKQFTIYMVCGNHDKRLPLSLRGAIDFSGAMKVFLGKKVFTTNRDFMYLTSGDKKFRICHPDMYSQIKGKIVSTLAQDLQENILAGHPHYFSMQTNKTGKYVGLDMPCLCEPEQFTYKTKNTTTCPEWNNGFVHIKNGKVRVLTEFTF